MAIDRVFFIIIFFILVGCKAGKKDQSLFTLRPRLAKENLILNYYSNLDGKDFIKKESDFVSALLEPADDPYDVLDKLPEKCLVKNIPKTVSFEDDHQRYKLFSFYSVDKNHLGECPQGKILFKTQYLVLYCKFGKSENILKAKYFYGESAKWLLKPIAKCNR